MAAAPGISSSLLPHAATAVSRVRRAGERIERVRPAPVLAGLVLAQLAVVAWVAHTAAHDGWLYATPGTDNWTAAWALGHLWVPAAGSFGLGVLLWPLALAAGGSLHAALPVLVVLQVAAGVPLLLLATYSIASRIGGRLFGYAAALAWILAPLVSLAYFYSGRSEFQFIVYEDYRGEVRDLVLPHVLGLAAGPPFLSLLAVTGAAWLVVRGLDSGGWGEILLGGLVAGLALGIDPGNVVFLPAPVLALAIARRPRQLGGFLVALLPAAATLALWRWTAAGHVTGLGRPAYDRDTFRLALANLKAVGFSALLVEWIAVAGTFAIVRKSPAKGALVAAWFLGFFLTVPGRATIRGTEVFRLLVPGFPAFVLLVAALILLVPGLGRPRREVPTATPPWPRATPWLGAAAVVLALYPLVLVALAGPAPRNRVVHHHRRGGAPVTGISLQAGRGSGGTVLRWTGAEAPYAVYRSVDDGCRPRGRGAGDCFLDAPVAATVRARTWTDAEPGPAVYRVAAVTSGGTLLQISPPVRVP